MKHTCATGEVKSISWFFPPAVYGVMKTYNRLGIEGGRAAWSKKVIGIGGSSSGN